MTDERTKRVRSAVALSAMCMAAIGVGLRLFAPAEVARMLIRTRQTVPSVQLLGAALLGFGAMNWIARASQLGGI